MVLWHVVACKVASSPADTTNKGERVDPVLLLLRVLHIGSGIFWVGSAFAFFFFFQPSARALGPEGEGAFMANLTRARRFPTIILIATIITIVAGLLLYLRNAGGLQLWLGSATGVGFTIGAAAALVSFAFGPLAILPNISKLDAIGATLEAAHRGPTPEEGATIAALQAKLQRAFQLDLVFLAIAVFFMATSRYLG